MSYPFFGSNSDFSFMLQGISGDVQSFVATDETNNIFQTWVKPRHVKMVSLLLIGAGGGGGGGLTGATTTARGGGGGGGTGGIYYHLFTAFSLPDVLKVLVRSGGTGAAAGGTGNPGLETYIAVGVGITAGTTRPDVIAFVGGGLGGGAGANSGAAAGGSAAGVGSKATTQGWAQVYSLSTATAGQAGANGGAATGAAGSDVTAVWNLISISAGAGGAGVNSVGTGFAGGNVTLQAAMDFADGAFSPASNYIAGGAAGSGAATGKVGSSGVQCFRPLIMTGGAGGGSADGQIGGDGGNGSIGCGGGGGGGGTTGGRGGNGGSGLAIICSW